MLTNINIVLKLMFIKDSLTRKNHKLHTLYVWNKAKLILVLFLTDFRLG